MLTEPLSQLSKEFTRLHKAYFSFIRRPQEKHAGLLEQIQLNASVLRMDTTTYLTYIFSWVKNSGKNPKHINLAFYGGVKAQSIVKSVIRKTAAKYGNAPNQSMATLTDDVLSAIRKSVKLIMQYGPMYHNDGIITRQALVNQLSPWMHAVDPYWQYVIPYASASMVQAVRQCATELQKNQELQRDASTTYFGSV